MQAISAEPKEGKTWFDQLSDKVQPVAHTFTGLSKTANMTLSDYGSYCQI